MYIVAGRCFVLLGCTVVILSLTVLLLWWCLVVGSQVLLLRFHCQGV